MTADVELYVREGSRFVRADLVELRRPVPPIPTPVRVPDVAEVDAEVDAQDDVEVDQRPNVVRVPAPRCPHGHFARWAARNCKPCIRQETSR